MADTYDSTAAPDQHPAIPQNDTLDPGLDQARSLFETQDGRDIANAVLPMIQQHLNAVRVADANSAVGQHIVQNLAQTKDNLVGMVERDPTTAELAVNMAPHLVAGAVKSSGLDPDQMQAVHSDLTGHLQSEIARAAVTSMADVHSDAARQLMSSLSEHLPDEDQQVLGRYIDTMQTARDTDQAAQLDQARQQQARASASGAFKYGLGLLDPRTESVTIPDGFVQSLMSDRSVQPSDKAPVLDAFHALRTQGDVAQSDPYILASLVHGIADPSVNVPPAAILQHVGSGLRYADAAMLHGMTLGRTPQSQGQAQQLSAILDNAQRSIAPNGDMAGAAAYGRFTNWLTAAYRQAGAQGLNPASPNYLMRNVAMRDFAPRHQDIIPPSGAANRPSLASIFGGKNG